MKTISCERHSVLMFLFSSVLLLTNSEKVMKAIPHLEFHAIDGAGHNLNYETYQKVNPLLIEFLKGHR